MPNVLESAGPQHTHVFREAAVQLVAVRDAFVYEAQRIAAIHTYCEVYAPLGVTTNVHAFAHDCGHS